MTTKRTKPVRTLRPLGGNVFEIRCGKVISNYMIGEVPTFKGERAFELTKWDIAADETYHVRLFLTGDECDCMGHLRHGHCKHVDAVRKILKLGLLAKPESPKAA